MTDTSDTPNLSRRKLLTRLGLAAGAVYVAPVMMHMSPAQASGASRGSRPSGPSRASRPSGPSRPSNQNSSWNGQGRLSRPSRPSRPSNRGWADNDPRRNQNLQNAPYWMQQILGTR